MTSKSAIRQQLQAARRLMTTDQKSAASERIIQTLMATAQWKSARSIGCYLAMPEEVATAALVQAGLGEGKVIAAPVVFGKAQPMQFFRLTPHQILEQGPMGIWQPPQDHPVAPEKIELLIVPGVGFDRHGYRIGYGGGFYDRFLAHYPGPAIGVGFDCQLTDALPVHAHDRPIHMLITETQVLHFSQHA